MAAKKKTSKQAAPKAAKTKPRKAAAAPARPPAKATAHADDADDLGALRRAVQLALRDEDAGPEECLRRWFAAERTGASPMTLEYGYEQQDPAFWVHGFGTPDAVCVVFFGEEKPGTMHVFGPVGVAALVAEFEELGETPVYADVFCEAAMQLAGALEGRRVFDAPPIRVGPQSLKRRDDDDDDNG